jgi:hypothetical protein
MSNLKQLKLLLCLIVIALCSCSRDEAITENPTVTEEGASVTFRLQSNVTAVLTRGVEESGETDLGTADESKVKSARVYFFDNNSKQRVKDVLVNTFKIQTSADFSATYETDVIKIEPGVYDIFVVANSNRIINGDTENEFLADIDSVTYKQGKIEDISNGIVMSNRGTANLGVKIEKRDETEVNIVTVLLERVLARLDVAEAKEKFELIEEGKTDPYATVTMNGYYIVNVPKYYYTYRHKAVLTSLIEPTWDINTHFGNIEPTEENAYVIDPYFFKKKVDASKFTNQDQYYAYYAGDLTNPVWASIGLTPTTTYSLENCMIADAQKNGYSTGIVFKAKVEPNKNVYRLNGDNLELITDPTQYPEEIYYCNHRFFNSLEAMENYMSTLPQSTALHINSQKFVKVGGDYTCYYNYWIKHLDNNNNYVMGVMEFGIVRNNLYKIKVTDITDLGYGPNPNIVPDTRDEDDAKLKVLLNVKKWVVRELNIVL